MELGADEASDDAVVYDDDATYSVSDEESSPLESLSYSSDSTSSSSSLSSLIQIRLSIVPRALVVLPPNSTEASVPTFTDG